MIRCAVWILDDREVEHIVLDLPVKPNIGEHLVLYIDPEITVKPDMPFDPGALHKEKLRRYRITEIVYSAKLDFAYDKPLGACEFVDVRAISDPELDEEDYEDDFDEEDDVDDDHR